MISKMADERESDRHTYLEVGVVRIHHYLGRTRDLKGLRGASGWISDVTDRDRLGDWIEAIPECAEAGLAVATDAGEADGVIPLQTALGMDVRPAAVALMGRIRERLPAVELKAYVSHGSSYVDAYQAGRREVATSLAAPLDFPALRTCRQCRVDAAVDAIDLYGEPAAVCVDCAARYVGRYLSLIHI